MAWLKLDSDTLTSSSTAITLSGFTSKIFNVFMHQKFVNVAIDASFRVGNGSIDTGSNYSNRHSLNGATDATNTSLSYMLNSGGGGTDAEEGFTIAYMINISDEEKLELAFNVFNNADGAGNAPNRGEQTNKWANTSNQFDQLQSVSISVGSFATDTNLALLGTD